MREGWILKQLGDCFPYIKNGANIKQEKNASGYPITRIETLSGGIFNRDRLGYANIFELDKYYDYILSSHDLLMSHINSKTYIGRTVEYIGEGHEIIIHGMNLLRLKSNNTVINSSFFAYYTHCHKFKADIAKIRKDAVNQSSFTTSDLKKLIIPVPPLAEQERIVAELDLLSGIIDKQKAQLKELDTLAQSIFYDMFGNPVENEKGWIVKPLQEVCMKITDGSHFSPKEDELGKYPMLSVRDMSENGFSYENCKYINEEDYRKLISNGCKPSVNDVLVAKDGSYLKTAFVQKEEREQAILSSIAILTPQTDIIIPDYLAFYFKTPDVKAVVEKHYLTGTAIKRVILKGFRVLKLPIPPLSLQLSFATKIELIGQQKTNINQSIAESQKLFDFTMDKYFS